MRHAGHPGGQTHREGRCIDKKRIPPEHGSLRIRNAKEMAKVKLTPKSQEVRLSSLLLPLYILLLGDVIHFSVLDDSLVVLNSAQAAVDLLDKRSNNYSDRPKLPIFDLSGVGKTPAFLT
ncbi:hypothetical protein LshimejAT787_0504520 [Lyophyllum shimeji]|uniref:Uncharacterized protein n=1 Tax=Lyophyllum shimeji TaxID=47721 RepID=A0A9P3PLL7_LYOSH|nr:hypothetical protein LshimejAT787_0504520 [Lyophyllum shimeji]